MTLTLERRGSGVTEYIFSVHSPLLMTLERRMMTQQRVRRMTVMPEKYTLIATLGNCRLTLLPLFLGAKMRL